MRTSRNRSVLVHEAHQPRESCRCSRRSRPVRGVGSTLSGVVSLVTSGLRYVARCHMATLLDAIPKTNAPRLCSSDRCRGRASTIASVTSCVTSSAASWSGSRDRAVAIDRRPKTADQLPRAPPDRRAWLRGASGRPSGRSISPRCRSGPARYRDACLRLRTRARIGSITGGCNASAAPRQRAVRLSATFGRHHRQEKRHASSDRRSLRRRVPRRRRRHRRHGPRLRRQRQRCSIEHLPKRFPAPRSRPTTPPSRPPPRSRPTTPPSTPPPRSRPTTPPSTRLRRRAPVPRRASSCTTTREGSTRTTTATRGALTLKMLRTPRPSRGMTGGTKPPSPATTGATPPSPATTGRPRHRARR